MLGVGSSSCHPNQFSSQTPVLTLRHLINGAAAGSEHVQEKRNGYLAAESYTARTTTPRLPVALVACILHLALDPLFPLGILPDCNPSSHREMSHGPFFFCLPPPPTVAELSAVAYYRRYRSTMPKDLVITYCPFPGT